MDYGKECINYHYLSRENSGIEVWTENVVNTAIIKLKYVFNGMGLTITSLNVKINVNFIQKG